MVLSKDFDSTLSFSRDFSNRRCMLLELPPEIDELMSSGRENGNFDESITFKGGRASRSESFEAGNGAVSGVKDMVLCTNSSTYLLKKAETTNTRLVLPNSSEEIFARSGNHFELIRIAPRLHNLRNLLLTRALKHDWSKFSTEELRDKFKEEKNNKDRKQRSCGFTSEELFCNMQASDHELRIALRKVGALKYMDDGGVWVLLEPTLLSEVFDMVISTIIELGMHIELIDTAMIIKSLDSEYNPLIVKHVFTLYLDKANISSVNEVDFEDSKSKIGLDKRSVARSCAETLLKKDVRYPRDEFFTEWARVVPEGVSVDPTYLDGMAFNSEVDKESFIEYLPVESLPLDVEECFNILFKAKEQWKLEELDPYLSHLVGFSVKKADLLKRHTRSIKEPGADRRVYVAHNPPK